MSYTMADFVKEFTMDHLKLLTPEERFAGLSPEERFAGLSPEQIVAGLSPEAIAALQRLIQEKSPPKPPE